MRDGLGAPQSILVLGGGSEIAAATVRRLVADRCRRVVLAARRPDELAGTIAELRDGGAEAEAIAFDADDTANHARVIGDAFGGGDIDVVLVAFGVLGDQDRFDDDPAAAAAAAHTNFTGAVSAALVAAEAMRAQGHGTLVAMSSVAGVRTRADNFVYGATKAGLDGLVQGLGDRLAGTGVRTMVIRPGFVRSKMTAGMEPAPLATTPDAVAGAITDGLGRGAGVVWVPPALRWVFAGFRLLPRSLWRRLAR